MYTQDMANPLFSAKLCVPPLRANAILRQRLNEKLDDRIDQRFTLVCAPAGFGKTTLLSAWASSAGCPVAWLSLDSGDGDIGRFLADAAAAISMFAGLGIGDALRDAADIALRDPEQAITAFLNAAAGAREGFALVLDDYHAAATEALSRALSLMADRLPPSMRLIISTRDDSGLPVARLRARDQVAELRPNDLRFSLDEAASFLMDVMGLSLRGDDIIALEACTEGWIAGLQLAALSLRAGSPACDPAHFSGKNKFVFDYLAEEVIQGLDAGTRGFLLSCSLPDRVCASLCDALSGRDDGASMLESLERMNLFIFPMDAERRWYRFHQLFAQALRARAAIECPSMIPDLHRRATRWFEANGYLEEALSQALASGDGEESPRLLELIWPEIEAHSRGSEWLEWAQALPIGAAEGRPLLCAYVALALLAKGELEAAEAKLSDAENLLMISKEAPDGAMGDLPATIAVARTYLCQARGDLPGVAFHADRALALLPETDRLRRGQANALLALAQWTRGDLRSAERAFSAYVGSLISLGSLSDASSATSALAAIMISRGSLRGAEEALARAQRLGEGGEDPPEAVDLYRGLGELRLERGETEAAEDYFEKADGLGEQARSIGWKSRLRLAQARLATIKGDHAGALLLLDDAERYHVRTPLPEVLPIPALRARIHLAQGRLAEALAWSAEQGLSLSDPAEYAREYEHFTLLRILIARDRRTGALCPQSSEFTFVGQLKNAAREGGRIVGVIEALLLEAILHDMNGEGEQARRSLWEAVALAEPEGQILIFLDLGPFLASLMPGLGLSKPAEAASEPEDPTSSASPAFLGRILAAMGNIRVRSPNDGGSPLKLPRLLADPLSARELEVLRLLATEQSGPEMASSLCISLNTLRTHTKRIFAKLDAGNRLTALRKAREAGLL